MQCLGISQTKTCKTSVEKIQNFTEKIIEELSKWKNVVIIAWTTQQYEDSQSSQNAPKDQGNSNQNPNRERKT